MPDNIVKPASFYGLLVLVFCLCGCDIWLLARLKHQDMLVSSLQYQKDLLAQSPMPGQLVPLVQGMSLKTKRPSAVKLMTYPRLVLLVFSPVCNFCEQNWTNWNKLFGSAKPGIPVYMISSDDNLPKEYIDKHPLIKQRDVILDVDPEVLRSFNVSSTPQTIYVSDGKVKRDWVGVLSKEDVDEVRKLLSTPNIE